MFVNFRIMWMQSLSIGCILTQSFLCGAELSEALPGVIDQLGKWFFALNTAIWMFQWVEFRNSVEVAVLDSAWTK